MFSPLPLKDNSSHLRFVGKMDPVTLCRVLGFPGGSVGKESACNARELGSIPGLGRCPGEGHGNPIQYSGLENPMDREAWKIIAHRVTKSRTRLND